MNEEMVKPRVKQTIKRSEIDKSKFIRDDKWILSLVKKKGSHADHVFLVLEGKENERAFTWFMDFVGAPIFPNLNKGMIRVFHCSGALEEELLYRCDKEMMDIKKFDTIFHDSWEIPVKTPKTLIDKIKQMQNNPPVFDLFKSSSAKYNCFTWARDKLFDFTDNKMNFELEDSLQSWISSSRTLTLVDERYRQSLWYTDPMVIAGIVGASVVVGGLVALRNSRSSSNSNCTLF